MAPDHEIGEHGIAHATAAVDQVGGAAHPDPQRTIEPVHFDDGFLLIGQQYVRQAVFVAKLGMRLRGFAG